MWEKKIQLAMTSDKFFLKLRRNRSRNAKLRNWYSTKGNILIGFSLLSLMLR